MSKNIHREIRNQVRAIQREKQRIMEAMEKQITSAFTDEGEQAQFRFNAFSIWGQPGKAEEVVQYLRKNELYTDDWFRGVFSMTKEQALTLGHLVEEWNHSWDYSITHDMADYNAFPIHFSPATGDEHEISITSPNGHHNSSWQWS